MVFDFDESLFNGPVDPGPILRALRRDIQEDLWSAAALRHNGLGSAKGVELGCLRRTLRWLRRTGRPGDGKILILPTVEHRF